jgi:hypothetical protein
MPRLRSQLYPAHQQVRQEYFLLSKFLYQQFVANYLAIYTLLQLHLHAIEWKLLGCNCFVVAKDRQFDWIKFAILIYIPLFVYIRHLIHVLDNSLAQVPRIPLSYILYSKYNIYHCGFANNQKGISKSGNVECKQRLGSLPRKSPKRFFCE